MRQRRSRGGREGDDDDRQNPLHSAFIVTYLPRSESPPSGGCAARSLEWRRPPLAVVRLFELCDLLDAAPALLVALTRERGVDPVPALLHGEAREEELAHRVELARPAAISLVHRFAAWHARSDGANSPQGLPSNRRKTMKRLLIGAGAAAA